MKRSRWFIVLAGVMLGTTRWLLAAGVVITPGEIVEFKTILTPQLRELAGGNKASPTTEVLAAIAVPRDFSPDRSWPILLVSATSDPGHNSSVKLLQQFAAPAIKAGWIVVAADPATPVKMSADNDLLRYALLMGALTELHRSWPGLAQWPRAFGGFSGGAKRSATLAAFSAQLGYPAIGVYQAGCNEAIMSEVLKSAQELPRASFLLTPVFLSSGRDDRIATPRDMDAVVSNLRRNGFKHVRLERFQGRHEVDAEHIEAALNWFATLAKTPTPP